MAAFGILARKGLVSLAAILTLIAGGPHFECRCPGGQVKSICFGAPSSSRCCCGGACCRGLPGRGCCCHRKSAPPRRAPRVPCCGGDQATQHKTPPPGGECLVEGKGCVKTLAPTVPLAAPSSQLSGDARLVPVAYLAAAHFPTLPDATGPSGAAVVCAHSLAPPRDRLLLLCRLLI